MALKNISGQPSAPVTAGRAGEAGGNKASKVSDAIPGIPKPTVGGAGAKSVDVALSDNARNRINEQKKAKDIAMNTPDVREDRVAAIKAKVDAGTYQVDSGKIADGMMREAIMEHLATDLDR